MKLQQLQITGFKSFKNTVSIHFGEGITGVVGPNGCGKSNIVDAILWVTGSALAHQLRGRQMDDIIFSGTQKYPPSHFSEVTLTLEKSGKWPQHLESLSQIDISRKFKRGGDSQYSINGSPCLLRDVQDILMSGGAQDWSIVEQDTITKLISSKPDQIKEVIEQTAGVAHFKNKKKSAENKLKNTLQNLLRVEDILNEQKKHLKKLERQAHQAQNYKELKKKVRDIELLLLKKLYINIEKKIENINGQMEGVQAQQIKAQNVVSSREKQHQQTRKNWESIHSQSESQKEALKQSSEKLNQYRIQVQRLQTLIEEKTKISRQWKSNLSETQSFQSEKLKQITALKAEIKQSADQIAKLAGSNQLNTVCSSLIEKIEKAIFILERWCRHFLTTKEAEFLKKSNLDQESVQKNQKELDVLQSQLLQQKENYEKQVSIQSDMEKSYQDKILHYKNLEEEISDLNQSLSQLSEKKHQLELELEALKVEKKNLEDKTWENYQIEVKALLESSEEEAQVDEQYLNQLKAQLARMGQVNLLALGEYDELAKEYEGLQAQYDDLNQSRDNLESVILEMEKICSLKFKETFSELNVKFEKIFKSVFGGGTAQLELTDDGLGVEILACPPGKKLKSLKLLSGGEKSLTALSIITSLFLIRPSPFCILDEVDSALDDSNISRFNSLMCEIAKKCQVILITHNKYSMRECHRLYGVTMEEKGITQLVSVEMKDHSQPSPSL